MMAAILWLGAGWITLVLLFGLAWIGFHLRIHEVDAYARHRHPQRSTDNGVHRARSVPA